MQGRLLNAAEALQFQEIVKNYHPNASVERDFIRSNFGVIAGPTGAGKDTLRSALIDQYPADFVRVLSTTTRPMREGEEDGFEYHFRSVESVKNSLHAQEFFQVALVHNQQISALHIDEIRKLRSNQVGLSILIVQTDMQLRQAKPDIKTLFIVPPSMGAWKARLHTGKNISDDEIERRLIAARTELEIALSNDSYFCLVSDQMGQLISHSRKFLVEGEKDSDADATARVVIRQLLDELPSVMF